MSNPKKSSGNPHADRTLTMFWRRALHEDEHNDHLQSWHDHNRVWELSQNLRSGEDEWFSEVLDQCRVGDLKEENYNFLHGLPTGVPSHVWYRWRNEDRAWHQYAVCTATKRCGDCEEERSRRNRLLNMRADPQGSAEKLADPKFKSCVLITPFNKAVFQYSIHRAQTFALSAGEPLFWMQAVDKPPSWFAGVYGVDELQSMKQRWLQYHARKTEGILSLCPCCRGMPVRVTSGNNALYREYGVHNGATGVVQAWELGPLDKEVLEQSQEAQAVLRALPKNIIVRMNQPLKKPYPGLPDDCFPMSPVTVYWTLDAEESIEIHRRGFPIVPNFSTTIGGATGKRWTQRLHTLAQCQWCHRSPEQCEVT